MIIAFSSENQHFSLFKRFCEYLSQIYRVSVWELLTNEQQFSWWNSNARIL